MTKFLSIHQLDSIEIENYKKLADLNKKIPSHRNLSRVFAETGLGVFFLICGIFYLLRKILIGFRHLAPQTKFIKFSLYFRLLLCFCIIGSYRYPTLWLAAAYIITSLKNDEDQTRDFNTMASSSNN